VVNFSLDKYNMGRVNQFVEASWWWHEATDGLTWWTFLLGGPNVWGAWLTYKAYWLSILIGFSYLSELAFVCFAYSLVALFWKSVGFWVVQLIAKVFGAGAEAGRRWFSSDFGDAYDKDAHKIAAERDPSPDDWARNQRKRRSAQRPAETTDDLGEGTDDDAEWVAAAAGSGVGDGWEQTGDPRVSRRVVFK
jgi:hypothetical protein